MTRPAVEAGLAASGGRKAHPCAGPGMIPDDLSYCGSAVVVQLLRSREVGWLADSVVSFGFPFSLNIELLAVALGS